MHDLASLAASPNSLAPHYARFRVAERLLLTGHSHQAWPDRAYAGQMAAWQDAATLLDDKWERAWARAERVRQGFRRLLADQTGDYTLGASTHELVVRWLSALPLGRRPRLVTTDGEFHAIRRQLDRLAEERIEVVRIACDPMDSLSERLAAAVDGRTSATLVSAVLFRSARIVRGLEQVAQACRRHGAELLVDAYHALNVVPFSLADQGLTDAFVVGGGYKYCQLGEGNCFLRVPADCALRPLVTGWFAEFDTLAQPAPATPSGSVAYGFGGLRFAGASYEPTSHYRAAEVFEFFAEQRLDPPLLRAVSQRQMGLLARAFDDLALDPREIDRDRTMPLSELGGFLALRAPRAGEIVQGLRDRGVLVDRRGEILRLGPAPYLGDRQLWDAMAALGEVLRAPVARPTK
jgi:kynureninase